MGGRRRGVTTERPSKRQARVALRKGGGGRRSNAVLQGDTVLAEPGDIKVSARSTPSSGWLRCNGAEVSRETYADLFDAIGTTYGAGDGSTTFVLPDFRGRMIVGSGSGPGLTDRVRAETGGEEDHTLINSEMPSHSHGTTTGSSGSHDHGGASGGASGTNHAHDTIFNLATNTTVGGGTGERLIGSGSDRTVASQNQTLAHTHSIPNQAAHSHSIEGTGGDGAHENMPPFLVVSVFIKT